MTFFCAAIVAITGIQEEAKCPGFCLERAREPEALYFAPRLVESPFCSLYFGWVFSTPAHLLF